MVLARRWLSTLFLLVLLIAPAAALGQASAFVNLTAEDRAWLGRHRDIRLGVDPARAPLEFVDQLQVYAGIGSDFVRRVNDALGIDMRPVPDIDRAQFLPHAAERAAGRPPALRRHGQAPGAGAVLGTRADHPGRDPDGCADAPFISGLQDLPSNRVGVVTGYATQEYLEEDYPDRNWVLFDTVEDAVAEGGGRPCRCVRGRHGFHLLCNPEARPEKPEGGRDDPLQAASRVCRPARLAGADPAPQRRLSGIPEAEKTEIVNQRVNVRFEYTDRLHLVGGMRGRPVRGGADGVLGSSSSGTGGWRPRPTCGARPRSERG